MKAIYTPKGKAKEYGDYACNLYRGCGHGCTYCYAPNVLRMDRQEFYDNPQPREGIIEALKKDVKKLSQEQKNSVCHWEAYHNPKNRFGNWGDEPKPKTPFIFLCFTADPYQPINREHQLTRQAIEILHGEGLGVNILTKGIITDWDLLAKNPHLSKVGITLTDLCVGIFNDVHKSQEPYAASYDDRARNILKAKKFNIKTWVSLEPVINPELSKGFINSLYEYVDEFKIGKWNYNQESKNIDWYKFGHEVEELCQKLGVKYYIKEGLRKEMDK
jgi:DNA repair photolyase